MKRYLQQAIRQAGGVGALADALGTGRHQVARWLKTGVPSDYRGVLNRFLTLQRKARERAAKERVKARERAKKAAAKARQKAAAKRKREREREKKRQKRLREKERARDRRLREKLKREAAKERKARPKRRKVPEKGPRPRSTDRQTFEELLKLSGEQGLIKGPEKSRRGRRDGPYAHGYEWVKAYERELTPELLVRVKHWFSTIPSKGFHYWQLMASTSQFARYTKPGESYKDFRGYSTVIRDLRHPSAGDFSLSTTIAAPRSTDREEAFREFLDRMRDAATDDQLLVLLHSVKAFNYNTRTAGEKSKWEAKQQKKSR